MAQGKDFSALSLLTLALGLGFLVAGIEGFLTSSAPTAVLGGELAQLFGFGGQVFSWVFAVLALVSGVVLLLAPFGVLQGGLYGLAVMVVLVVWLIKMALELFFFGNFQPLHLGWYTGVAGNLVILIALWMIRADR